MNSEWIPVIILMILFIIVIRQSYSNKHQRRSYNTPKTPNEIIVPKPVIDWSRNKAEFEINRSIKVQEDKDQREKDEWVLNQLIEVNEYKSLQDLIDEKPIKEIGYYDLLSCVEWKFKRFLVLFRDKFQCRHCGQLSFNNHVHHTYYLKNKLPWDIDLTALITLCRHCHYKLHRATRVETFQEVNGRRQVANHHDLYCSRCHGSGYLHEFRHVQNGICFKCKGDVVNKTLFSTALHNFLNSNNKASKVVTKVDFEKFLENITLVEYKEIIRKVLVADNNQGLRTNAYLNNPITSELSEPMDDLPF